jgi:hypothetical protein
MSSASRGLPASIGLMFEIYPPSGYISRGGRLGGFLLLEICLLGGINGVRDSNPNVAVFGVPL